MLRGKTSAMLVLAGMAVGVVLGTALRSGAQSELAGKSSEEDRAAQMEAWQKESGPDEHHQRFDPLVGKWKMTFRSPGETEGQWEESEGSAEYRWILGGRFLMEEARCDFGGMDFEWVGLYGYDRKAKAYKAVWADNFGTDFELAECGVDKAVGMALPLVGEQTDPQSGKRTKFKWVMHIESKEKARMEMYEMDEAGAESKSLEVLMTR